MIIARNNTMAQQPLKLETHRIPRGAVEGLKHYLHHYHPRSWWKIDTEHDACNFSAAKGLADIVYAYCQGWSSHK
jgi:hypothetical protein